MVQRLIMAALAVGCAAAALVWIRSTRRLYRAWARIEEEAPGSDAAFLAKSAYGKDVQTTILYAALACALAVMAISAREVYDLGMVALIVPVVVSLRNRRRFVEVARLSEERSHLERRAEEVLEQEELAPRRWAARLAPEDLPEFEGFEIGHVYQPGAGLMAGDFYDLCRTAPTRLAAVVGDVSGHGIEPSITAFQVRYLLRVLLRQYRDPAQALEELNHQMAGEKLAEEFVSIAVVIFDEAARTLRYASAGHPPAWLWHDGEVRPLRATGPLLMLEESSAFTSREIRLDPGDLLLLYTDGLAEARRGEEMFGEDRIAGALRRDPGVEAAVLCKQLIEAASDFADSQLSDDVAILAIRRV